MEDFIHYEIAFFAPILQLLLKIENKGVEVEKPNHPDTLPILTVL